MKVLISGDFCPNHRVIKLVEQLDVQNVFNDFLDLNNEVDYSIVNLECPIKIGESSAIEKIGPALFTGENAVKLLKKAGFNGVTLANNHIKDIGEKGVLDTVEICEKIGIDTVGAGRNKIEASKVLFKTIDNVNIGFYNVAENEFSVANEIQGGANPHDSIDDYYNIHEASKKCDFLIVIYHGGHEGYSLPSPRMKKLFRFYADAGASTVVCHHAHRYSGYEVYKETPIFYGLGNFCFDWPNAQNSLWNRGYSVMLEFVKNEKVNFKIYGYIQGSEQIPGVRLMTKKENIDFEADLRLVNEKIVNDHELKLSFISFCKTRNYSYLVNFEPYNNNVLRSLFKRGLLPSFLLKRKLANYLRCESHLEVLNCLLKEE